MLLLITSSGYSQRPHHQILSFNTENTTPRSRGVINFPIGQQSVTATKIDNLIVQQGFQQKIKS